MTESELREPDEGDAMTAEAVTWERAIGVLVLALQQPPEAVAYTLQAAARRHGLPLHALADAVETAAQGRRVQEPLPRKVWWEEWGDLLPLLDQLGAGRSARGPTPPTGAHVPSPRIT